MKTPKQNKQKTDLLLSEFEQCDSDVDRWRFVIKHAAKIAMMLDNDQTSFSWDEGETWHDFNGYIGRNDCAVALCVALGFKSYESV